MNISDELQEYRIRNIYPNNYLDHLNNRNHPSELNTFQWLSESNSVSDSDDNHPHLSIDSSEDREVIKNIVKKFIL